MRYLSGVVYESILRWEYGGLMLTPMMGNRPNLDGVYWAADNGCYTAGDKFSAKKWTKFLRELRGQGNCLFAVAPDVPFDMQATIQRSLPYLETIRNIGYPAALAIQNGVENVKIPWDDIDAVFIAGDKSFKTCRIARDICFEAKSRCKLVHIARRNSAKALQECVGMYADTCDGTFLRFGPDKNWPKIQMWFRVLSPYTQMELW